MKKLLSAVLFFNTVAIEEPTYAIQGQPYDGKKPMEIYSLLVNGSIVTFSKDCMICSGLDKSDVEKWNATVEHYKNFINQDAGNDNAPKVFKSYMEKVSAANAYAEKTIESLHNKYATVYRKNDKSKYVIDKDKIDILDKPNKSAKQDLKKIVQQTSDHLKSIKEAFAFAFNTMLYKTPIPAQWSNLIEKKDIKDILPNKKSLFEQYKKLPFDDFLRSQKVESKATAEKLANTMEQVIYIQENKLKSSFSLPTQKNDRKTMILHAQKIIEQLRLKFPDMLTDLDKAKMYATTDKASTTLFALAGILEGILGGIERESSALLAA